MTEKQNNILFFGGLAIGGIFLYKIGTALGLIKTAEEKANEEDAYKLTAQSNADASKINIANPMLSFNPNYWTTIIKQWQKQNNKTAVTVGELNKLLNPIVNGKTYNINLAAYCDRVYNAKKIWFRPDTEADVFGVLRSLKNQAQLSKMASVFLEYYKTDLLEYIKSFMNDAQQAQVYNIVKTKKLL